mmetsp:Transcript_1813/g.5788  ORF Transcript_1813/g.5788 Transcript_1813/m.5788 type:complete len:206 (-) Transcript_1813:825-1442(-)
MTTMPTSMPAVDRSTRIKPVAACRAAARRMHGPRRRCIRKADSSTRTRWPTSATASSAAPPTACVDQVKRALPSRSVIAQSAAATAAKVVTCAANCRVAWSSLRRGKVSGFRSVMTPTASPDKPKKATSMRSACNMNQREMVSLFRAATGVAVRWCSCSPSARDASSHRMRKEPRELPWYDTSRTSGSSSTPPSNAPAAPSRSLG